MATTRRALLGRIVGAAALSAVAGCLGGSGGDGDGTTTTGPDGAQVVEVGPNNNYKFAPGTDDPLKISPGTTVRFVWKSTNHNVHVTDQPDGANWQGHDAIEGSGFEFESEFETPGTYEYVCEPHESLGMVGTIVVEESSG